MFKKLIALMLACCLCAACCCVLADESLTVTDMAGREVTLNGTAKRIVVLQPADCEILYAIGAGDLIVGRGTYCDYPETVFAIAEVSSGYDTNIEQILALEPDVVIMTEMSQTVEQNEALVNAGVNVIVSNAQDIKGIYEAIRLLGAVTGKNAEAEALITDMQTRLAALAEKTTETEKTVYFEVSPLEWGLWTAGSGTFMDEIALICGLKNAFSDVDGWAAISEEQVLSRDPDYIVTISMYYGYGPTPVEEIAGREGWGGLKAVEDGKILNADSNEVSRPGPRIVDAAETLYQFIAQ